MRALTYTSYLGDRISLHFLLAYPKGSEKKVIETGVTYTTYIAERSENVSLLRYFVLDDGSSGFQFFTCDGLL